MSSSQHGEELSGRLPAKEESAPSAATQAGAPSRAAAPSRTPDVSSEIWTVFS